MVDQLKKPDPWQHFQQQLTCSICLDKHKDPEALPCQYGFCMKCLGQTAIELQDKSYFMKCTNCCTAAEIPRGGVPGLLPAFTIDGFLELQQVVLAGGEAAECSDHKKPLDMW